MQKYGLKYDYQNDEIVTEEGTEEYLKNLGFTLIFDTMSQAIAYGHLLEYNVLREEIKNMSLEEIDSEYGKELQRKIWKTPDRFEDNYPSDTILYGAKIEDDKIMIEEGYKDDLRRKGYDRLFSSYSEAKTSARNLEYRLLRYEYNAMSVEELDSERSKALEKRLWGNMQDDVYVLGDCIKRRKKALLAEIRKAAH